MEGSRDGTDWPTDRRERGTRWTAGRVGDESWLRRRVHDLTIIEFRLTRVLALTVGAVVVVLGAGAVFGSQAQRVTLGLVVAAFGTPLVFATNAVVGFAGGWVGGQYFVPAAAHFFDVPWLARPPFEPLVVFLCALGGAYTLNRLFVFVFALPFGLAGLSIWDGATDAVGFEVFPESLPSLAQDPLGFLVGFPLAFLGVFLGLGSAFLFTAVGMVVGRAVLMWGLLAMTAAAGANLALDPAYPTDVAASLELLDPQALVELNVLWDLLGRVFTPVSLAALGLCLGGILWQIAVMPHLVREDAGWTIEPVD